MVAVTNHLRPAPYQYGLLTLRLLGKLGGKNRSFLQLPMDINNSKSQGGAQPLSIECMCSSKEEQMTEDEEMADVGEEVKDDVNKTRTDDKLFGLPLPLHLARLPNFFSFSL